MFKNILGVNMELLTIVHPRKIEYIPVIYEFVGKIKRHILFFDHAKEERAYAEELKRSIEKLNTKYGVTTEIKMIKIDEDSKRDMQEIAKVFEGKSKNIYLNGAGADTALFTVLSSIILRNNGQVIAYDKEDNSYNLITQNGFLNKKIEKSMKIDDFLTLMGEELIEESSKEQIAQQKEALGLIFGDAKRMFKVRYFLKIRKTKELRKHYSKVMDALKTLMIIDENDTLRGQEGFVRFGYLFEEFIYLQLEAFAFDDIKVGARIRFDQGQVDRRNIEVTNEFDILTIYENKIGFIECKLGDSSDALGTIYKSDSIMEYFGESASSLIVNIERNKTPHLKNSKKNFGASLLYRAKTKKVAVYNAFDFSKTAFRNKVSQAFGIEIKEMFQKENFNQQINQLQNKFERE
jgi:hypothetical protein